MTQPIATISELATGLRSGLVSSRQIVEGAIARITALDGLTNAFIGRAFESALAAADRADEELSRGIDRGPLHGIPYGVKDIFDVKGERTTCHSFVMLDNIAQEDSHVVSCLEDCGAVYLGKLATHEFALGGPSYDLPFPPARNPWDLSRQPGASSSGSAVAVAAGFLPLALGSDTTGSIRGPAALCGVVGLKPTYGVVSRRGVFPLAFSMDCFGPLTWTIEDNALVLEAISKHDPFDASSVPPELRSAGRALAVGSSVEGLRIGSITSSSSGASLHPDVAEAVARVEVSLREAGAVVQEITIPEYELFDACGRIIKAAESYAIHADLLRKRPEDYGNFTFQRIAVGAAISARQYMDAQRLRLRLSREVNGLFANAAFDALICPTNIAPAPQMPPPEIQISSSSVVRTIVFALTGHPALSVPCGFSADGLPLGIQVAAGYFAEATSYRIGAHIERQLGRRELRPDLRVAPA